MALADQRCETCTADTPTFTAEETRVYAEDIDDAWQVDGEKRIQRNVKVDDFATAMTVAVRIGFIAEAEGHHPDLEVGWGRLGISLTTHAAGGLTRNDFILAAKIDRILRDV